MARIIIATAELMKDAIVLSDHRGHATMARPGPAAWVNVIPERKHAVALITVPGVLATAKCCPSRKRATARTITATTSKMRIKGRVAAIRAAATSAMIKAALTNRAIHPVTAAVNEQNRDDMFPGAF